MKELRTVGFGLATRLAGALGKENVQSYCKAAIVGLNGEAEHGTVWHEAGGWAMREVLGNPKAMVPASQVTASAGFRLIMRTSRYGTTDTFGVILCFDVNGATFGVDDCMRRPLRAVCATMVGCVECFRHGIFLDDGKMT